MGSIVLFSSARDCDRCGGSGRVEAAEAPEAEEDEPANVAEPATAPPNRKPVPPAEGAITSTTTTTSGTFTLSTNATTGSGSGGDITINAGSGTGSNWVHSTSANNLYFDTTDNVTISGNLQISSPGSDVSPCILVGADEPPEAPVGSLYIRDDGNGGTLWFKVSEDKWSQISSPEPISQPVNLVINNSTFHGDGSQIAEQIQGALEGAAPDDTSWHGEIIEWTRRRLTENQDMRADQDVPDWQCGPDVPAVAPVSAALLADLMALVEQEGHEVDAFVTSCRDFADVRKFMPDTQQVRWEGKRVWVYGVEVLRSADLPVGWFSAVSRSKKMSVCSICR